MACSARPSRLAILGGAFNPPHWGHIRLAQTAQTQACLDGVLWIPSDVPPHKAEEALPAWQIRHDLVQQAIAPYPTFQVWPTPPPAYGVDLLEQVISSVAPPTQWFWTVGFDTFQTLPRWYRVQGVAPRCTWLVAPRLSPDGQGPGVMEQQQQAHHIAQTLRDRDISITWHWLDHPPCLLSSSQVRHHCRHGQSIQTLVPPAIASALPRLYAAPLEA
jgi:nicotinate-nucleotide adenylyltransferase